MPVSPELHGQGSGLGTESSVPLTLRRRGGEGLLLRVRG